MIPDPLTTALLFVSIPALTFLAIGYYLSRNKAQANIRSFNADPVTLIPPEKYYTNALAPLYAQPSVGYKLCDIPRNYIVIVDTAGEWKHVTYKTSKREFIGWVYASLLEPYIEPGGDSVIIDNQTEDPNDAEQFTMYRGVKQFNLCGELCAAKILGVTLSDLLTHWEAKAPSFFRRVFSKGRATGTGIADLISMFDAYQVDAGPIAPLLYDTFLHRSRYTVTGLLELMRDYDLIVACRIDNTGYLVPSGVLHWVVVRQVIAERAERGQVCIYNPFSNCPEWYSWREFAASAGAVYGVAVRR